MRARLLSIAPLVFASFLLPACAHHPANPYESASAGQRAGFKRVRLPFASGTAFRISQGAFSQASHADPGHGYTWDFDVPYGTPVVSVEDGVVFSVWQPAGGSDCDSRYSDLAHHMKVKHSDGTIAQYVHIQPRVEVGTVVRKGQIIAITAKNGFICSPQLDFGVYRSEDHLFGSAQMETVPVLFDGLPEGIAREGDKGKVP